MTDRLHTLFFLLLLIVAVSCGTAVSTPAPVDSPTPFTAEPTNTLPPSTTEPAESPTAALTAASTTSPAPLTTPTIALTPQQTEMPGEFIPARDEVVRTYGLQPQEVILVRYEGVEWPTSCLGVELPGMACLDVITPGYRLYFDTPQGIIVVHTNSDATVYYIVGPESGIDGEALVGPACGGPVVQGTDCPDQPYVGTLWIMDEHGGLAAEIITDKMGRFQVTLPPGIYMIMMPQGTALPSLVPQPVDVSLGRMTQVQILLDSGIR